MKAYFIHDPEKPADYFFIPETDQLIQADGESMYQFISAQPDFSQWQGESLNGRAPESLGVMVASRKEDGDVCIVEQVLWQERMMALMSAGPQGNDGSN